MTTQDTWSSLVPGDQMQPFQDIWNTLSRRSIFPVADNTERDDVLIPWLAAKGMEAPSADNPLYVHNASLPVGAQLQSTVDGSAWATYDSVVDQINLAYTGGFSPAYGTNVAIRRNGWVSLFGSVDASSISSFGYSTYAAAVVLPPGWRPAGYSYYPTIGGGTHVDFGVRVQTTGTLEVMASAASAASISLSGVSFPVA